MGIVETGCEIIGILKALKQWLFERLCAWRFRQVFEDKADGEFHIIYKESETARNAVFPTVGGSVPRHPVATTNLTTVNSCATTRSVAYLAYEFGKSIKKVPLIKSHRETDARMDLSFVSIGSVTNPKTQDLVQNGSNKFLDYRGGQILAKNSGEVLVRDSHEPGYDYAYIIKIHPMSNPKRTWICCGGIGEWGTSGAAWYLANRWKEIWKWAKNKEFALITKTRIGSDESTEVINRY